MIHEVQVVSEARFGYGIDFLDILMVLLVYIMAYTFSRIKKLHQNAYDANKVNSEYYKKNRTKWLWINYITCFIVSVGFIFLAYQQFILYLT